MQFKKKRKKEILRKTATEFFFSIYRSYDHYLKMGGMSPREMKQSLGMNYREKMRFIRITLIETQSFRSKLLSMFTKYRTSFAQIYNGILTCVTITNYSTPSVAINVSQTVAFEF